MGRRFRAEAPSSLRVFVRLSPSEHARMKSASTVNHQTISAFARDALVTAVEDCLEDLAAPPHFVRRNRKHRAR